jgi:membrane protease YdiL (CAAX protease family)
MRSKWLAPILPYLAVWAGLFVFKNAWVTLLGFHLAILLALVYLRPALPLNVFFRNAKAKHVLSSILICGSGGLGLYFLWDVFGVADDLREQLASIGLSGSTWRWFIVYFFLANPFFEEYFWRGVLGSDTKQFYLGDLIYAGYHILVVWNKTHPFSTLFMVFVLTFAGWFWRQLYRRDGSLIAPILGHMAADLSILLAVYFKVR